MSNHLPSGTKLIELRPDGRPPTRIQVPDGISCVKVPMLARDGFGDISLWSTGLKTKDGIEIWTPQRTQGGLVS